MGVSILSMIEVIYYIFLRVAFSFKKRDDELKKNLNAAKKAGKAWKQTAKARSMEKKIQTAEDS